MNSLALLSLGLFVFFGIVRTSSNIVLAQAAVITLSCGLYVAQNSTTDFVYLFFLTQAAFAVFKFVSARPRTVRCKLVWMAALSYLAVQLLYFKAETASGGHMPVGLAYLTLQLLGIFVWAYFQKNAAVISWTEFCFSALFFPTIIAGPILRTERIAAQLSAPSLPSQASLKSAFLLICLGLFKKAVADQLGLFTNESQVALHLVGWRATLLTVAFYSQCYADFSGYSDIARGLARAYGIEIPLNFNLPFLAANITDHWKRWHISLNEWFRDYVFTWLFASNFLRVKRVIPWLSSQFYLGASIFFTCLLIGVWHGLETRFLTWAAINALFILLHQSALIRLPFSGRLFTIASVAFTFSLTCILNLLFLDTSLDEIQRILQSSLNLQDYVFVNIHDQATIFYSFCLVLLSIVGLHLLDRKLIALDYQVSSPIAFAFLTIFALVYCFSSGAIDQAFLYSRF